MKKLFDSTNTTPARAYASTMTEIAEHAMCVLYEALNSTPKITADAQGAAYIRNVIDSAIDEYWRVTGIAAIPHRTGTYFGAATIAERLLLARVFWDCKLYTHDCDRCVYIGTSDSCDVYIHSDDLMKSIVLRMGSDGTDYISIPEIAAAALDPNAPIFEIVLCALTLK